jgi:hypothetical protein
MVTRTGGFAGRTHSLVVTEDGRWLRVDGKAQSEGSGQLSPDALAALRTALREADFPHLPRVAMGDETVFDGFTYAFTHAGREVVTQTGDLPAGLQRVLDALPGFDPE